jgi:DNA-directed RNA polymerase subunit F
LMGERKPLLADGSVVGSYEPLFRYWEAAKRRGLEELTIGSEELKYVEERVRREGRVSLLQLLSELAERFLPRVDPEAAREAFESLGLRLAPEEARRRIAEILAGWALEAARALSIVEFKGWVPPAG